MNAEIERILNELIARHGVAAVKRALDPLLAEFKWSDWLTVCNYLNRASHRKVGKKGKLPVRRKSDAVK
jgi:hypothetical protein